MLENVSSPKTEICSERNYEKEMENLLKKQKGIKDFLRAAIDLSDIFGSYALEKTSFMETIASCTLLQHSLVRDISKIAEKIDK